MSDPDLSKIMAQAQRMQQKMQEQMQTLQRDLAGRRYEAASGGGMVKAVVSGELRVLEIEIEPGLVANGDRDMIQDLAAAAVNAALTHAQRAVQEEVARLQSSLVLPGIPGMPDLPGAG